MRIDGQQGPPAATWRCALVWGLATATLATVVALGIDAARELPTALERGATFDETLVALSGAVAALVGVWLWALTSWGVRDALRGQVPRTSGWWRRATMVACGCAATVAVSVPAHAGAADTPDSGAKTPVGSLRLLDGLPYPDRPTSGLTAEGVDASRPGPDVREQPRAAGRSNTRASSGTSSTATPPAATPPEPRAHEEMQEGAGTTRLRTTSHVVRSGETLWSIATDALARRSPGGAASAADVVRAVERLHDANRETVGDDPDLVVPGQRLTLEDLQVLDREDDR